MTIKTPRFLREYANYKINQYQHLAIEYPHQKGAYLRMVNTVNSAVWNCEHGYITVDEAMRTISESSFNTLD